MDRLRRSPAHHSDEEEDDDDEEEDEEEFETPCRRLVNGVTGFLSTLNLPGAVRSLNLSYVLPISLPLIVVLVLALSPLDLRAPFRTATLPSSPSRGDPRLEAELRALRLLNAQQLALLRLWERTSPSNSTRQLSPDSPPAKRTLLDLIKLNTEIQKELLPPDAPSSSPHILPPVCKKLERSPIGKTAEWKPHKDRFLLAICVSGQMSDRLTCLRKHIWFAAVLDRVLVLPSRQFGFRYERIIDVTRINGCVGRNRKVVITFEEFARSKRKRINRFVCYKANPPCLMGEGDLRRLKGLGMQLPKVEVAWPEDGKKRAVEDVKARFATKDEVLAVGDLSSADVEEGWVMQPGGPASHGCDSLIEPSRVIKQTAERFVQTYLGKGFVALDFRRRDFLDSCNGKVESCFFPIPQAAECILQVVEMVDSQNIYLSTDVAESETTLLQSLLASNKNVVLIRRPRHTSTTTWDALLYNHRLGRDDQVMEMLDRTISAMSSIFIGSPGSKFTEGVTLIRRDRASASTCDEYLCQGKQPSFVASKE